MSCTILEKVSEDANIMSSMSLSETMEHLRYLSTRTFKYCVAFSYNGQSKVNSDEHVQLFFFRYSFRRFQNIHVYLNMYVYTLNFKYIHICIFIYIYIYICMHKYMHICLNVYVCGHECRCVCTYACMRVWLYVCVGMYTYIFILYEYAFIYAYLYLYV